MKVSTRGRYALRLMLDLAQNQNEGYVPLKDMAKRQGISTKYLEHIVNLLGKAEFLESVRGPQGGYRLRRDVSEYSVGEILHVTEGEFLPTECLSGKEHKCNMHENCTAARFWCGLQNVINDYIYSYKLVDLLDKE
ncbi:MAG: RrF2 family transcriptional regulator [Eubacteriales bacterium]